MTIKKGLPWTVRVTSQTLTIRKEPHSKFDKNGTVSYNNKLIVTEIQNGFGKLKDGRGWIALGYTQVL